MSLYFSRYSKVPKTMPKKEAEQLLSIFKELKKMAVMENAVFGFGSIDDDTPTTEYIKEKTRIYRDTWLIQPLDDFIERYETFLNNK